MLPEVQLENMVVLVVRHSSIKLILKLLNKTGLTKKVGFLLIMCWGYVIISCDREQADYYHQIPHIEQFDEIVSVYPGIQTKRDTSILGWYISKKDSLGLLSRVSDIVQVNSDEVWISDFINGEVYSFNISGKFNRKILDRGKGPNETIQPYSMGKYQGENETLIFILDAEQKAIIVLDKAGNEKFRSYNENVEHRLMEADIKVLNPTRLMFPTYNLNNYALAEFDSKGNFKKGLIPRLIPYGFQPMAYNDLTFDYSPNDNLLVYAYKGLPLIFLDKADKKTVLNLKPTKKLENLNVPLDTKPENASISVKMLVRNIFIEHSEILVTYLNHILEISIKGNLTVRKNIFSDQKSGKQITFHFAKNTEDFLFLIDGYRNNIYKVPKTFFN